MDFIPLDTLGHIIYEGPQIRCGGYSRGTRGGASKHTDDGGVAILEIPLTTRYNRNSLPRCAALTTTRWRNCRSRAAGARRVPDQDTWGEALAEAQVTPKRASRKLSQYRIIACDLAEEGLDNPPPLPSGDDYEPKTRPPTQ